MKSEVINTRTIQLGNNEYEAGAIVIPAAGEITIGAVLKRTGSVFELVTNSGTETPVAVNTSHIENTGGTPITVGFRPMISGMVRRDMLTINGAPITDAEADMLRDYGIIAVKGTDISREDNH
jgi:hypothetical protein